MADPFSAAGPTKLGAPKGFLLHLELDGLFEVFVTQTASGGSRFQFFPAPAREASFDEYLARRFAHLGAPAEAVHHPDLHCFVAVFPDLRLASPEDALRLMLPV